MVVNEIFTRIEQSPRVEIDIAIKQLRAVVDLRGGHMRVEPGPRVDLAVDQCGAAIGMLEIDDFHVVAREACRMQGPQCEEERIGALGRGDLLALEIRECLDRRVLADDQCGPFGTRKDIHRANRIAIRFCQYRGESGCRTDIDCAAIQVLQCAIASETQYPFDFRVLRRKCLFEPAIAFDDETFRRVVRVIEFHFRRRRRARNSRATRASSGASDSVRPMRRRREADAQAGAYRAREESRRRMRQACRVPREDH